MGIDFQIFLTTTKGSHQHELPVIAAKEHLIGFCIGNRNLRAILPCGAKRIDIPSWALADRIAYFMTN